MKLLAIRILRTIVGYENIPYVKILAAKYGLIKKFKSVNYDYFTAKVIQKVLQPDSVAVDVGCHHGIILGIMMKYCTHGRLFAFEPLPKSYKYLVQQFKKPNIKIYNIALSDKQGTAKFNYVVNCPAYSGLQKREYLTSDEKVVEITVKTDLLDNILFDETEKISLIKIDVEGAELQVLLGAKNIIKRDKPIIVFEYSLGAAKYYGTNPEDVYNLLCLESGLKISLLDLWLNGENPFSQEEFKEQYYTRKNHLFIAYP